MIKNIIKILWIFLAVIVLACVTVFFSIAKGWIGYMPPVEDLENPNYKFATQVFSEDGKVLGTYSFSKENRVYVGYNDLSPNVINALIATEDVRFAEHSGIDAIALFRAIVKRGLLFQKNAGGGSTITQQLSKQLYSPSADNVMERLFQKPIEWVIAVKLERYYTKEEILTMYLNKFDFLNNAVGIKTAANTYFGCEPKDLKIEEAATLVGMCKNPALYNPVRFNERSRGRRNVVLDQMRKAGYITAEECDSLQALPLTLKYTRVDHKEGMATYFREYLHGVMTAKKPVKSEYRGWQMQKYYEDSLSWETNPLYGWCEKNIKKDGSKYNLYTDGLKIYTTIDSRMQQYAEEAVEEHLKELQGYFFKEKKGRKQAPYSNRITKDQVDEILARTMKQSDRYRTMKKAGASDAQIEKAFNTPEEMSVFTWNGEKDTIMTPMDSIRYYKHFLRAGFMSMDPHNGHVKAYVGGPNYNYFQYDMAMVGRRQIGSTMKPYVYSLAMENGFSPCDEMRHVEFQGFDENGKPWAPRNANNKRYGEMVTLKWGLANSVNNISGWVLKQFTPEAVAQMAHKMGITSFIDPVPSVFLGTAEITVKEMVAAYSIFANKGVYNSPLPVYRIEDKYGNVLQEFRPESREVITENTAYLMCNLLEGVVTGGTGVRLRYKYKLMNPMGGKTGTTQKHADGWFMGVTPDLVGGVWVGAEDRSIHFQNLANGQGASMALPIWAKFLLKAYADPRLKMSDRPFDRPAGINKRLDCDETISEAEVKEMNNGIREDAEEFY